MRAVLFAAACGLLFVDAFAAGVPFWGARESMPADTLVGTLQRGQFIWYANAVPDGPVLMVVSLNEQRAYVYRTGIEIGRARAIFSGSEPIGTHVLTLVAGPGSSAQRFVPKPDQQHWIRVGLVGHEDEKGSEPEPVAAARIDIPAEFVRRVFDVLTLGTTVLVTDEPITPQTTGPSLDVINADAPES